MVICTISWTRVQRAAGRLVFDGREGLAPCILMGKRYDLKNRTYRTWNVVCVEDSEVNFKEDVPFEEVGSVALALALRASGKIQVREVDFETTDEVEKASNK